MLAKRLLGTIYRRLPICKSCGHSLLNGARAFSTTSALNKLTDFQEKKVLFEFENLYDRNQDGFIDKEDISKIKRDLRNYVADSQRRILKDLGNGPGFDGYWQLFTLMADTNHDGKISKEEWIAKWTEISDAAPDASFTSLPQWIRLMPNCMFPIMDTKGDGILDLEEYSNFWYHLGLHRAATEPSRTAVQQYYNHLTQDGSKEINLNRFEELYADFYLSKDPKTPGKYIAGPIDFELK